jgi:hypothetical protein
MPLSRPKRRSGTFGIPHGTADSAADQALDAAAMQCCQGPDWKTWATLLQHSIGYLGLNC